MASGSEHYRRAEVLLESCQLGEPDYDPDGTPVEGYGTAQIVDPLARDPREEVVDDSRNALMAAQTHATLALAAATADAGHCCNGWTDAIAKKPVATS